MMVKALLKIFVITIVLAVFITASDPHFGIDLFNDEIPKAEKTNDVVETTWKSTDAYNDYLNDKDNRVSDIFPVTPFYYPNVRFWFMIYTKFTSSQAVIHDKSNLSLVYKVLDYSSLQEKGMPKNVIYVLQQKTTQEKLNQLRDDLGFMAKNPFSLEPKAKIIYRILKEAEVKVPIAEKERSLFFNKLKENIRSQTGQKNFIRDGMVRSLPYRQFIHEFFGAKGLPEELFAIPFLESSFNPRAESKVAASGVWQFMPLIASYYLPKRTTQLDYRFSIAVSSVGAAFLLYENFKIMKSWDLAVTAYNSGTKHLLRTKRELASSNTSLEDIIKHSDSVHFGFASKNFYSEFLALIHTLAYREELFEDLHKSDRDDVEKPIRFFISKCNLKLKKLLAEELLTEVTYHNHHVRDTNATYPKGLILATKSTLPKSKFFELNYERALKKKPQDWIKELNNQSCSTR